ncbi:FAD-binding protein [Streptomyces sp. NBC_01320]|nr:FAD-binding protein [Streptomyces sp. NBC_01320]
MDGRRVRPGRAGPAPAPGPRASGLGTFPTLADGGLAVDTNLRVTDTNGEPIRGLWAAGSTGQGGVQLLNHGLHIEGAMISGRLAGRHVAQAQNRLDLKPVEPVPAG